MPLIKRIVEPSELCRQELPQDVQSELECVTNNTLSGVILQLSSLSLHAEDVFQELFTEANMFYERANVLQERIDKLSVKVTELDSTVEEVSLHDINLTKPFRSSNITDQQVVSRESLPVTLLDTYNTADKPPPLQELNVYRDDGRDGLKIYTDPDYFFNLWREAMQKEMRDAKEKRREQRKKEKRMNVNHREQKQVRAAVATRKQKAKQMQMGAEFAETPANKNIANKKIPRSNTASSGIGSSSPSVEPVSQISTPSPDLSSHSPLPPPDDVTIPSYHDLPPPPPSIPNGSLPNNIPPPPPMLSSQPSSAPSNVPPPPPISSSSVPPPPPAIGNANIPPPPPPPGVGVPPPPPVMGGGVPAPPPPPPAGVPAPPPVMAPPAATEPSSGGSSGGGGLLAGLQNVQLKKREEVAPPPETDARGGLLQAIRLGINLKKVEQREKREETSASSGGKNDVASILARRIAVEFTDSEDSEYSDEGEWD